jgi:predicted oxidoreductase
METVRLGEEIEASRIAYGCTKLGGLEAHNEVEAAVHAAVENGITLFDHADIYARGRSEEVFGRFLADRSGLRERVVLQSKCGIRFADDPAGTPKRYDLSREHIIRSVEGSLQRLRTDRLDVLLLHRPDPLMEPEEVAHAFDDLHAAGKVRAFGVSNFSVPQIDLLTAAVRQPLIANQIQLSLGHRAPVEAGIEVNRLGSSYRAEGLIAGCWQRGLRLQAWAPLVGGALSRPDPRAEFATVTAQVRVVAERLDTTPLAVVVAWLLRHPASIQPVIGTTNPRRIAEACGATEVHLGREAWYDLFEAARGERIP